MKPNDPWCMECVNRCSKCDGCVDLSEFKAITSPITVTMHEIEVKDEFPVPKQILTAWREAEKRRKVAELRGNYGIQEPPTSTRITVKTTLPPINWDTHPYISAGKPIDTSQSKDQKT